ncbi:MAG: TRAP transporter large permease subunit [Lewinellaceae bacterium]|nr:TRAP transporter large permease subunit [Saprospiraceae bacterium]MCB9339174.1 TRAP transporter large permease subunit [Lewinellaceae bacterium]
MSLEILALILFISVFILILYGYPVAFTLGGLSILYALCFLEFSSLEALPSRFMGVLTNYNLIAVPLFIFMGIMLEKSGLAESLLDTMAMLFGKLRGGLAISVVIVGTLLAASTGIVGATVVTMGFISLPTMLKRGYQPELATGAIAASGTLGQIIPPSVVLVLLGSTMNINIGDLFAGALLPGLLMVVAYILYIIIYARLNPKAAPLIPKEEFRQFTESSGYWKKVFKAFVLPMLLIMAVLGSIFLGWATSTEAAGVGALGASLMTIGQGKFKLPVLKSVMQGTTHLTCMVFVILLGATTFSLVFREMGGDRYLVEFVENSNLTTGQFLFLVMLVMFVAGFFIDFIEIIFIIVPVVVPVFIRLNVDLLWLGILIGVNLQTSFLTPPFGFSLFYLKGVAPPEITTGHLYRGILPFVLIQITILALLFFFPEIIHFSIGMFKFDK